MINTEHRLTIKLKNDISKQMKPIPSTAEILVFKMIGDNVNKKWTDWAYEMLLAGFETENLIQLAGELEPYNQFELQRLTDNIFEELNLKWDNEEQVYENYACYLIGQALDCKIQNVNVLNTLKDIYIGANYELPYHDFYALYYAQDDLRYSEDQWYWPGATRENIDAIIREYFVKWKANVWAVGMNKANAIRVGQRGERQTAE